MSSNLITLQRWIQAATCAIFLILTAPGAPAQGTFQNLDFESAHNIPAFDPSAHPWYMSAADALPGWSCYVGTNQVGYVSFNDLALDSAWVALITNTSAYYPMPAGLLSGRYCVSLEYGVVSGGPLVYGPASIAQSGQVPAYARSIQFRGTVPFTVTFAGNAIPLVVLSAQGDYSIYGGDISQFAGQTGELRFISPNHFNFLDAIQFSTEAIPEPSTAFLFIAGGILLGIRSQKCRS
jgi:hypothetical protein